MPRLALLLVAAALAGGCARRPPPPPPPPDPLDYAPLPQAEVDAVANPHDHGGKPLCQRCHERGSRATNDDPVTICAGCHDTLAMRHPWRVEMEEHVEGLPLMEGNVVACHTCHDPHAVKARRAGLRLAYSELCKRCHQGHRAK